MIKPERYSMKYARDSSRKGRTFHCFFLSIYEQIQSRRERNETKQNLCCSNVVCSDIYAANHSDSKEIAIQKETADLIYFALQMSEQTGGMLDLSIYPVLCAWGFATDNKQVPSADELESLLKTIL